MNEAKWQDAIALGHAARRSGRREEALTHYRAALALAPDQAETNGVCGSVLDLAEVARSWPRAELPATSRRASGRGRHVFGLRGNSQIKRRAEARRRE